MLTNDLLKILACPACKGSLQMEEAAQRLHCQICGLEFQVTEGIPVMLVDEAIKSACKG